VSKRKSPKPQVVNPAKMGMHWLSNATWAPSGYGVQARLFVKRLKALGYEQSMTAFYGLQGHTLNLDGMLVFPVGFHPYGLDVAANNANAAGADILLTNIDTWVVEPPMFANTRWVPWFPVDSEPMPKAVESRVRVAFDRIVYSKFALAECEKVGLSAHYVPMGVDTKAIYPMDRVRTRKEFNDHIPLKIPDDKFIVSMVAMNKGNPSRKAFIQNIRAFKELHEKHPDTALYLHCTDGHDGGLGGINLPPYIENLGLKIGVDVFFPDQQVLLNGYPDEFMNSLYNSSGVLAACSLGEGFGIPIIEAQAAGCPVIVGDWTSMPELLFAGWKVDKKDAEPWWNFLDNYMFDPHWHAIYEKMELAYAERDNLELRAQARAGAMAFDADLITEKYWKPVLALINENVQADKARKAALVPAQPREDNDTLVLQQCGQNSEHGRMMALTMTRNVDYCLRHKIDFQTILADIDQYRAEDSTLGFGKVALIRKALEVKRYRNIIWLDADVIIADLSVDIRTAVVPGKIGAVWHDLKQNGQILGHHNVGVLAVSNCDEVKIFFDKWLAKYPGKPEFPWLEQGAFAEVGKETGLIATIGAEWNSVDYVNPCPHPVILGFHGYQERLQVMREALAKLEKDEVTNGR